MNSFDDFLSLRREMESRYPSLSSTGSYRIERSDRDFWSFYHAHKDALRQAKLYVVKDAGSWTLVAHPLYDPEARKREELTEKLSQWQDRFLSCCVPEFSEMLISETVMKNGVKQYKLFCPVCEFSRSSALPYMVAEYLIQEKGMRLRVDVSLSQRSESTLRSADAGVEGLPV